MIDTKGAGSIVRITWQARIGSSSRAVKDAGTESAFSSGRGGYTLPERFSAAFSLQYAQGTGEVCQVERGFVYLPIRYFEHLAEARIQRLVGSHG